MNTWFLGDESKSIFKSRTFWVNLVMAIVSLTALPEITALLGPDALKYVMALQSAGNIILRYMTTQPVHIER